MNLLYYITVFLLGYRGIAFRGIKIADLFILMLFFWLVIEWILRSRKILIDLRFLLLFLSFFVIVLASLFKVGDFTYSILDPFRYVLVGVFFICIYNLVRKPDHLKTTLRVILISGFITSLLSIIIFTLWLQGLDVSCFLHKVSPGEAEARTQPFFYDPNHYASFLLLPALFCLYNVISAYEKKKVYSIFIFSSFLMVISLAVLSTGSRGGILSLFLGIGCAIILYLFKRFYRKSMLLTILFFLSGFLILLFLSQSYYFNPFFYRNMANLYQIRRGVLKKELFVRIQLWLGAFYAFKDNPLIGVGTSDFINDYPRIANKYRLYTGAQQFPHNSYLDLLAEMGILGFIAGMSLLFYIYRNAVYNLRFGFDRKLAIVLFSLLIAQSVEMLFYSMFHARRLWFLFALIVAYNRITKQKRGQ